MLELKTVVVPHFLYHLLIIFTSKIMPWVNLETAGYYVVPLLCHTLLGLVIYSCIAQVTETPRYYKHSLGILMVTLALMLVAPISFVTWPNLYLGYIGITVYHNPTITLVKPLSLLLFCYVIKVLTEEQYSYRKLTLLLVTLTTLSLLSKPSYIICLIPALFIYICYCVLKKASVNWLPIMVGIFLPAFLILSLQYSFTYGSNQVLQEKSSIILAPFLVMNHLSNLVLVNSNINLMYKFILSILFPLIVYFCYLPKSNKDVRLVLAWLTFGISVFYTYFLAESGARIFHGNFAWSGQISLFILFVTSTLFVLENRVMSRRFRICISAFTFHLVGGLLFYAYPNNW